MPATLSIELALMVVLVAVPPERTIWVPPRSISFSPIPPVDRIWVPPLLMVVALAVPPEETSWVPPEETTSFVARLWRRRPRPRRRR